MLQISVKTEHDMEQAIALINLRAPKLKLTEIAIYIPTIDFANMFMANLYQDLEALGNGFDGTRFVFHFVITSPKEEAAVEAMQNMELDTGDTQENDTVDD